MPSFPLIRVCLGLLLITGIPTAQAWELETGQQVGGDAIHFDYETKSLGLRDPVTGKETEIPVRDLSLRSRQRLLVSEIFHQSYPDERGWPEEKSHLLRIAILSPAAALFLGFWIGGLVLAKKVNPLRALVAFLGGWLVGGLFLFFYLYFAGRFGGGAGTVVFGAVLGTVFLSLFVSAIYSCTVLRGFLIFLFQIFAAAVIGLTGLFLAEILTPRDTLERFWEDRVFIPSGLMPPRPNPFETGSPSSGDRRALRKIPPPAPIPRRPCPVPSRDLA